MSIIDAKLNLILDYVSLIARQQGVIMTAQDDINAAVTTFGNVLTDLQAQTTQLQTDITNLTAVLQGQGVDTSALTALTATAAAIDSTLDTAVQGVTALAPGSAPAAGRPAGS